MAMVSSVMMMMRIDGAGFLGPVKSAAVVLLLVMMMVVVVIVIIVAVGRRGLHESSAMRDT